MSFFRFALGADTHMQIYVNFTVMVSGTSLRFKPRKRFSQFPHAVF